MNYQILKISMLSEISGLGKGSYWVKSEMQCMGCVLQLLATCIDLFQFSSE